MFLYGNTGLYVLIPYPPSDWILMDPTQLDQVLVNLAVNAREVMPDGGKLTIETQNVDMDEDYAAIHPDARPGGYVMLAVSDNGRGMDRETMQHIFEPFFSTRKIEGGTGLGLATVYGIVQQNGGLVNVYSEKGHGTTFKIYFPRATGKQPASSPSAALLPRGRETILLVEDEDMVRHLTRRILEKLGYTVLEAGHSADALRQGIKYEGEIHLLLTDVIMPDMNGRELHRELLKIRPQLKALFMSGYTETVIARHSVLEEGVDFLQKPFTTETLSGKVRQVLDQ